jgi:hypothetical protein
MHQNTNATAQRLKRTWSMNADIDLAREELEAAQLWAAKLRPTLSLRREIGLNCLGGNLSGLVTQSAMGGWRVGTLAAQ